MPSQPGVGHLISRFSGLEGSRKYGEGDVGKNITPGKGSNWVQIMSDWIQEKELLYSTAAKEFIAKISGYVCTCSPSEMPRLNIHTTSCLIVGANQVVTGAKTLICTHNYIFVGVKIQVQILHVDTKRKPCSVWLKMYPVMCYIRSVRPSKNYDRIIPLAHIQSWTKPSQKKLLILGQASVSIGLPTYGLVLPVEFRKA